MKLPPEQQAIRDGCFHPSGTFVEFPIEDVETSIPARFEKIVRVRITGQDHRVRLSNLANLTILGSLSGVRLA